MASNSEPSSEQAGGSQQVLSPDQVARVMLEEGRGRRRVLLTMFIGMSLWIYCWFVISLWFLIVNTSLRTVVPEGLVVGGVVACFVVFPIGLIFSVGYLVGRAWLDFSRRWLAAGLMPLLLGLVVIFFAVRHRLDSSVLFKDILGCELPAGAWDISHEYEDFLVEQHAQLRFFASREALMKLHETLGLEPEPDSGIQTFDSVPCHGDHADMTIDWTTGEVRITYLNV